MTVRPLTSRDLGAVVELWNGRMTFDPVTVDRMAAATVGDPTVDPDAAVVAEQGGKIVAVGVFGRRAAPAPDERDADAVHLKVIFYRDRHADALAPVLARLATVARRLGRRRFVIRGGGGGPYLVPGIDLRHEWLITALDQNAFTELEILQDAEVDLRTWTPNERQLGLEAKLHAAGIEAVAFSPVFLPAMREFAPRCGEPEWFPTGWEEAWARAGRAILAIEDGKVLSYAEYTPDPVRGWFGPTATLPDRRDQGIGTLVLTRTMQALQAAGTPLATASWVWPPEFYLKSGWHVSRRYAALEKKI